MKGGYKENPRLSSCRDDPVIAEPEVQGPIPVTADLRLLVIATRSLCEVVRSWCGERSPQQEVARLLGERLAQEPDTSLSCVAQSTLDHVVRRSQESGEDSLVRREDMTLLVR